MEIKCKTQDTPQKKYVCTCQICGRKFSAQKSYANLCSPECRKERKRQNDYVYRQTEHGQAVRRKNRKNPITIATRKRYEQTEAFKERKHRRNKLYMQTQHAQELDRVRKLNYYYSHYSKKHGLFNPQAHRVTLDECNQIYTADTCYYCGQQLQEEEKTIDHKIPVSRGGTNELNNLVICCLSCNSKKNDRTEEEYRSAI